MRPIGASVAQMMGTTGLATGKLGRAQRFGSWLTTAGANTRRSGAPSSRGGQVKFRVMVVHVNHAIARTACRASCAYFQVDLMGGNFNAFSYRYFRTGSQQIAGSLQDSSLAALTKGSILSRGTPMRTTQSIISGVTSTWLISMSISRSIA